MPSESGPLPLMAAAVHGNRPVRAIKCAATVNSLAKSWQSWANQLKEQQDTLPSGWMPTSIMEDEVKEKATARAKLSVKPRVVEAGEADAKIRSQAVTKSFAPRRGDRGSELVTSIKERIATRQTAPDDRKPFPGRDSPTRRRHCDSVRGWSRTGEEERRTGSRSSSLDAEDSRLEAEEGLSDNSKSRNNQNETAYRKYVSRPKVKVSTTGELKNRWQQWSVQHSEGQKLNPFSEDFSYEHAMAVRLHKGDAGYGRPKEGSKTAERAERARRHIRREMDDMCFIIRDMGLRDRGGRVAITFGRLFDRYVKISDKVVGILLRCRKHGMLDFEGEMLWKGQDDCVIITLTD